MAGIGDEIGAHLLDPAQWREVVKRDQHDPRGWPLAGALGDAIGATIASCQRSIGTRSKNSTRCGAPLAIARADGVEDLRDAQGE